MKYRRLNQEELEELKDDFIKFLASNSVLPDDWKRLRDKEKERALKMLDVFSDIIFEKVLTNLAFLQFKSSKDIKTFSCGPNGMELYGIRVKGKTKINFNNAQKPADMLKMIQADSNATVQIYASKKPYLKERNIELFEMMENGCKISNGVLYKTLEKLKSPKK